jgi:energy-coupling factor transporter ATP-binding protein EcfA2
MTLLRSDIEKALDDLISNEGGMTFQGLAVVLAKQRWPDLIASERKKDLGADAIAKPGFAAEGVGKVLACSLTATLAKVRRDAEKIKTNYSDVTKLVFATPEAVTNQKGEAWAAEINKEFGYELAIMPREDIITSLMNPSNAALCRTHLGLQVEVEETVAELVENVRAAAAEVTATWSSRIEGKPLVELRAVRLDQEGRDSAEVIQLSDIQVALAQSRRLVLEGPAGRGKTTTLVQLAKAQTGATGTALLIDLPAWTRTRLGLLEFIAGMPQFQSRSIDAGALARASYVEHFSFLLNGWNEIAESESAQAENALRELERSFPAAGIIVATRTHHIVPPLPGAMRARLLTITRRQRTAYLRARLGKQADEFCRKLDSDPLLDDLTRTPFILSEVTAIFEAGAVIPTTKMGVLDAVTRLLEQSDEHRNPLRQSPLAGRAPDYLCEIATRVTAQGGVTASEEDARLTVTSVATRLQHAGQIAALPEPAPVLNALCAHHVLERHEYPAVTFRFEHQQFQEFYSALGIERQLWEVLQKGDENGRREFTKKYVNEPAWAEPLRMIADDIGGRTAGPSGREDAVQAGALLVEMALRVDPVFAAELARLCGAAAWRAVGTTVTDRLRSLYAVPDDRYRQLALAAMLAAGSEEFKDVIVPILSGDDQQARLGTYRAWSEFHLSSLGPNWRDVVRSWNEEARVEFVSEILHNRNVPEVASFALGDPSLKVKQAATEGLSWIGAEEDVVRLLETLGGDAFEDIVQKLPAEFIPAPTRDRAVVAHQTAYAASADPLTRLRILLKISKLGKDDIVDQLKDELGKVAGKTDDHAQFVIRSALDIVRLTDAQWVSHWVAQRVADGSLWHEDWKRLITSVPEDLKETLLQRMEREDFKHVQYDGIIAVLAAASDVPLAERVFSKLCALRRIITDALEERHEVEWAIERQLETFFRDLPTNVAVAGLSTCFSRAVDAVELDVITRVFSAVGRSGPDLRSELKPELRDRLRAYLKYGVAFALQQDDFSGELKANVASVLALVGEPDDMTDLRQLILADIERVRRGRAARARGDRGKLGNGGMISYANWHVRAVAQLDAARADLLFVDLLREPEYERDVAEEMVRSVTPPKPEERLVRKADYRKVWQARAGNLRVGIDEDRRKRYASAIRDRIAAILKERSNAVQTRPYDHRAQVLATALAAIDSQGSAEMVFEVMSLPDEWDGSQQVRAIEHLLFNGVPLPADRTLTLLDASIDRFRKYGFQQQDVWMVKRFLCVLPFVDVPAKGIEKVRQIITELRIPDYELRDVLEAVGHSRCNEALVFLRSIATDEARAKRFGDAWINAVAAIDSPESRDLLLSFIDPDLPGLAAEVTFGRDDVLAARIVELARRDAAIQQRLLQLCSAELRTAKRSVLSKVVGQLGTVEAVLAGLNLIDDNLRPSIPYDIWQQVEAAFVEHRPHGKMEGAYTLLPQSSNAIRAKLLEMAMKDERRKKSAFSLLAQIEGWRLEYGRPTGEPRHPAFDSEVPWPLMQVG